MKPTCGPLLHVILSLPQPTSLSLCNVQFLKAQKAIKNRNNTKINPRIALDLYQINTYLYVYILFLLIPFIYPPYSTTILNFFLMFLYAFLTNFPAVHLVSLHSYLCSFIHNGMSLHFVLPSQTHLLQPSSLIPTATLWAPN